jgi:RimJ/RimL family protein N-acetyltransferase
MADGEEKIASLRRSSMRMLTDRLELVAMNHVLAVAQSEDRMRFFAMLGVRPTAAWPPPLLDIDALCYTRDRLAANPDEIGWQAWVWIDPVEAYGAKELVGFGGFNGAPGDDGIVEIGYSLLPAREGFGYASEAVAALLSWAAADQRVRMVIAHTREDGLASQRLLRKQGFTLAPDRPSPDVLRWERAA